MSPTNGSILSPASTEINERKRIIRTYRGKTYLAWFECHEVIDTKVLPLISEALEAGKKIRALRNRIQQYKPNLEIF